MENAQKQFSWIRISISAKAHKILVYVKVFSNFMRFEIILSNIRFYIQFQNLIAISYQCSVALYS